MHLCETQHQEPEKKKSQAIWKLLQEKETNNYLFREQVNNKLPRELLQNYMKLRTQVA